MNLERELQRHDLKESQQQVSDSDEKVFAFPIFLLDVEIGSLSQTEDRKIQLPFSINQKDSIHEICGAVLSELEQTIETLTG